MEGVFPEALSSLRNADPELFSIIEDEKERQWYFHNMNGRLALGMHRARPQASLLTITSTVGRVSSSLLRRTSRPCQSLKHWGLA